MAGSVNKVILIGRLGKDPDIKSLASGRVANLSLATSDSWRDKASGEKKEKTTWHNVSVFGDGLVGVIEKYTSKGDMLYIEGKLQTRKWQDQSGQDRYTTEVVVSGYDGGVTLLQTSRSASSQAYDESGYGGGYEQPKSMKDMYRGPTSAGSGNYRDKTIDDEIPF